MLRDYAIKTVVIANGATTSAAIDARQYSIFAVDLPATFTGVALTFTSSDAFAGTYQPVNDNTGAAVTLTVAQGKNYDLPTALGSVAFFKIVSGAAEGGARSVVVICKG